MISAGAGSDDRGTFQTVSLVNHVAGRSDKKIATDFFIVRVNDTAPKKVRASSKLPSESMCGGGQDDLHQKKSGIKSNIACVLPMHVVQPVVLLMFDMQKRI